MMEFKLFGRPITKKNSQRIVTIGGRARIIPSAAYKEYHAYCLTQLAINGVQRTKIDVPVNLRCVYYMPTRHKVDLVNLLEATCDILVDAEILADDNSKIVAGHDGSRVEYDKYNPRVEITITPMNMEV